MLRSVKDIVDAQDAGRVHVQRFLKNAGTAGDNVWHDWSYQSGQPAYDARIGDALAFTPAVAVRNDAVWFPGIPAGMERRLLEATIFRTPGGGSQERVEMQWYDLVGYYPLIDGDSTDEQDTDNTLTLPRFESGEGIFPVLVNHVAPALAAAGMLVTYTNSDGVSGRTVTWTATIAGINNVCYAAGSTGGSNPVYCNLAAGDKGIRSIERVQFVTPPGGLWCVYLCKPLMSAPFRNFALSAGVASGGTDEYNFAIRDSFRLPVVKDGAWIGCFYMPVGGARTVAIFGNLTFIWG